MIAEELVKDIDESATICTSPVFEVLPSDLAGNFLSMQDRSRQMILSVDPNRLIFPAPGCVVRCAGPIGAEENADMVAKTL
jgi:hypothetical protein